MAATLWTVDWIFTNFNLGFNRINLFTSQFSTTYYTFASTTVNGSTYTTTVQAPYYGLYGFNNNAPGKAILPVTVSSNANVKA